MPTPAPVLLIENVSKRYEIYARPQDRLRQFFYPRLQRLLPASWRRQRPFFNEFWAVREVSIHLNRGDALGILGRNGAGKSTLLQIVAGTLAPTSGSVAVSGKVAALLELGSGFSPEFTGRENVRLNASLLGLSASEIDDRFDAIAEFADIGEFMEQPVKTYSSGMLMRLAFAVQTAVEPELLIVDEALAVGDARFQKKCFGRLAQLREQGTTILFVTHDTSTILLFCTRAIILEHGRVYAEGDPQRIGREYHKLLFGNVGEGKRAIEPTAKAPEPSSATGSSVELGIKKTGREVRYGSGEATITRIGLRNESGESVTIIETYTKCEAYFRVTLLASIPRPISYGFIICNARGVEVYGTKSALHFKSIPPNSPNTSYECRLRFDVRLVPGRYFMSAALAHDDDRPKDQFLDYRFDALEFEVIGLTRTFTSSLTDLDAELTHVALSQSQIQDLSH
ncbi:MAG: ABC transporter ATP-binding protein [Burkholderiaceae bacterium]